MEYLKEQRKAENSTVSNLTARYWFKVTRSPTTVV